MLRVERQVLITMPFLISHCRRTCTPKRQGRPLPVSARTACVARGLPVCGVARRAVQPQPRGVGEAGGSGVGRRAGGQIAACLALRQCGETGPVKSGTQIYKSTDKCSELSQPLHIESYKSEKDLVLTFNIKHHGSRTRCTQQTQAARCSSQTPPSA